MEPSQQNQFDFITDPSQGQRSGGPNFGNKKRQITIGIIFSLIVLSLAIFVGTLLFSKDNSDIDGLIKVQSYQIEIDRVLTLGQKNISDTQIKQRLGTLQTVLLSDQNQLSGLLSGRGAEVTPLQLAAQKDSKTDTALTEAVKLGNHDETLQKTVNLLAEKYYTALKSAKEIAISDKEKALIDTSLNNIDLIFKAD